VKDFTFPIRTTPWGSIKPPSDYEDPDMSSLASPLLAHEPAALKVENLPTLPVAEKEQVMR
jgi:adenylylsulfate reductase subunit B